MTRTVGYCCTNHSSFLCLTIFYICVVYSSAAQQVIYILRAGGTTPLCKKPEFYSFQKTLHYTFCHRVLVIHVNLFCTLEFSFTQHPFQYGNVWEKIPFQFTLKHSSPCNPIYTSKMKLGEGSKQLCPVRGKDSDRVGTMNHNHFQWCRHSFSTHARHPLTFIYC